MKEILTTAIKQINTWGKVQYNDRIMIRELTQQRDNMKERKIAHPYHIRRF